jgi:hypothetical protein
MHFSILGVKVTLTESSLKIVIKWFNRIIYKKHYFHSLKTKNSNHEKLALPCASTRFIPLKRNTSEYSKTVRADT